MTGPSALDRPIALAELVDAAVLDEVLCSLAEYHGVGWQVLDIAGSLLGRAGVPTELCTALRERPAGLARCDARLWELRAIRPAMEPSASPRPAPARCECFSGLRYQVAGIVQEGSLLGTLVLGPYLPEDRPAVLTGVVQSILGPARDAQAQGVAALAKLRPMSDARARETVEHAAGVLDLLLHTAYAQHLTAQLHVATLAQTYEELTDKNERLAAAVERMQEVDRLKSSFLATVSHELRTPLTSVIGYSEMLLEGLAGQLNQEQREYVQIIMEKGDQLLQLISGILDVSRMEAGTLRLSREPIDLGELIQSAMGAMAPLARRKKIDVRPPVVRAPRVKGDREKLRQVLLNLVGNAVKFTPEGGRVDVLVEVGPLLREGLDELTPTPGQLGVRMRVADSGIGIAPEKQARIFEPFFQVDSSSTREYGGTGLGLTLVKSYVEAHGGRVWVESELGRGSSFTVTLPAVDEELVAYLKSPHKEATPPQPA